MTSSSDSKFNKLIELVKSDIGKKVLIENPTFLRGWWRSWEEWEEWNAKFQEMIKEEKKRQRGY